MDPTPRQQSLFHPSAWRYRSKSASFIARQYGKWGYILAWALGVPIPILIIIYLLRGCN